MVLKIKDFHYFLLLLTRHVHRIQVFWRICLCYFLSFFQDTSWAKHMQFLQRTGLFSNLPESRSSTKTIFNNQQKPLWTLLTSQPQPQQPPRKPRPRTSLAAITTIHTWFYWWCPQYPCYKPQNIEQQQYQPRLPKSILAETQSATIALNASVPPRRREISLGSMFIIITVSALF